MGLSRSQHDRQVYQCLQVTDRSRSLTIQGFRNVIISLISILITLCCSMEVLHFQHFHVSSSFPCLLLRLRQNLREKHSRHVADLKAYYESEIQILRDKLKLRDLPQDLERSNQALTERYYLILNSI